MISVVICYKVSYQTVVQFLQVREMKATAGELQGQAITAWIYLLTDFNSSLLALPLLSKYNSKGPHGLEFNTTGYDCNDSIDALGVKAK